MNPSPAVQGLWQHVNRPSHPMVVSLYEKYANELLSTKPDNFRNEFNKLKIELYKTPIPEDIAIYINSKFTYVIYNGIPKYQSPEEKLFDNLPKSIYQSLEEKMFDNLPKSKTIGDFINKNSCCYQNNSGHWIIVNKILQEFNDAYYGFTRYIKQIRDSQEKEIINEAKARLAKEEYEATAEQRAKYAEEQKIINEAKARLAKEEYEANARIAQELYEAKVKAKMDELRSSI